MATQYKFEPDYAVAPGETLKDVLDDRGVSQSELAARTGLTEKTISQIVHGVAPLSYDTAEKLELALGVPARFWNARESRFREATLKLAERERLEAQLEWLECIPVKALIQRNFIKPAAQDGMLVREVLKFFQVSTTEAWAEVYQKPVVQFHSGRAQERKPGYVATWLRMGEVLAEQIACGPFQETKCRAALQHIRGLMVQSSTVWQQQVTRLCAEAGVAVVFVPEIRGASVRGVTKWLSKDKAMIVLSHKFKQDDQFWFTFFHEAGHVLKHGKKAVFYEFGNQEGDQCEREADKFARDWLIPPSHAMRLGTLKSRVQIRQFAHEIGVPPGIVVGRMQRDGICQKNHFQDLKVTFRWGDAKDAT
jgi:HTH-type transcriptional regulator / antitoxin HigA